MFIGGSLSPTPTRIAKRDTILAKTFLCAPPRLGRVPRRLALHPHIPSPRAPATLLPRSRLLESAHHPKAGATGIAHVGRPCGACPATSQSGGRTPPRSSANRSGRPERVADRGSARAPPAPKSAARKRKIARRSTSARASATSISRSPAASQREGPVSVACAGLRPAKRTAAVPDPRDEAQLQALRRWVLLEQRSSPLRACATSSTVAWL